MKKFFVKVHLWLSIPFGIIIAIVCLTGAILVFETEILELCHPSRYFVNEIKGQPKTPAELISSARHQLPDSVQITGIRAFADPERTWQLVLPGKKAACFINPYTGEITGIDNGQGFFMQTMRLHRWLLDAYKRDGSFSLGKAAVGYATLVFAVILLSGLVCWFPRNKKVLKNRLKIKTSSGWRRFFYDLHVSGGFYTALLLLVLTLTGLTWSFGWYRDAFYTVFGVNTTQTTAHATPPTAQKESSDENVTQKKSSGEKHEGKGKRSNHSQGEEKGNRHVQTGSREKTKEKAEKTDYTQWATVLSSLQSRYTDFNSITLQDGSASVSTARYGNTRGSDQYTFSPITGEITGVKLYKDLPRSGKIRGWIYSVHVGSWGGMTTRILSCLVSLLGAVFAVTGYYFWIKKRFRKRKVKR